MNGIGINESEGIIHSARYAFRQAAIKPAPTVRRQKSAVEAYAVALNRLAALFHDIGKSSVAFQAKLYKGTGFEAIRHDLLSFLMLAESLWTHDVTDAAWLQRLVESPRDACRCASGDLLLPLESRWVRHITERLAADKGVLIGKADLVELSGRAPGLLGVLWLVLSHHRLPDTDALSEQLDAGRHLNKDRDGATRQPAQLAECLVPHSGPKPWDDKKWQAMVRAAAQSALSALNRLSEQCFELPHPYFWPHLCAHLLRPSLILSDHLGSIQADKGPSLKKAFFGPNALIYANRHDAEHAGDSLVSHLTRVSRLTRQMTTLALAPAALPVTSLPGHSLALKQNLAGAYQWQQELGEACARARKFGPVFTCIVAETGAGKSLAAVRAMHNLSPQGMRFTLALGLRSLTVQSAQSMLADAGIRPEHLTVAVGQPHTLGLVERARELEQEEGAIVRPGSESSAGVGLDAVLSNENCDVGWLRGICDEQQAKAYWGAATLAFLSLPVVACTVDHLVAAVALTRGAEAKLFLRMAHADLVLDEIDAYSATDLQTIGKLAFACGLNGRHLTLMSATMGPAVREGIFLAWRRGVSMHAALKNKPLRFGTVYASNQAAPVTLDSPTLADAANAWAEFVARIARAVEAGTGPRRVLHLHELQAATVDDAFDDITNAALRLHASHNVIDPATGKRVSIGFVRLNTAKHAWRFARYLAHRPQVADQPELRFVCYHSKYPRSYLGVLDAVLEPLTCRKDPSSFLQVPALRAALDSCSAAELVVIVSTTTLIETGRDFDFDWAVLEPRSVRGEVQAVGRVRRHRREALPSGTPNVLLLSTPLKALEGATGGFWRRPGVEDALPGLAVTEMVPRTIQQLLPATVSTGLRPRRTGPRLKTMAESSFDARRAEQLLPVASWRQGIDARVCLGTVPDYADNRIGYLEQQIQFINLLGDGAACLEHGVPASLAWYFDSFGALNVAHARSTRFRGHRANSVSFIPLSQGVQFVDEISGRQFPCTAATVSAVPASAALIPDLAARASRLQTGDKHVDGAALPTAAGLASSKSLTWDPLLGFLEGQASVQRGASAVAIPS